MGCNEEEVHIKSSQADGSVKPTLVKRKQVGENNGKWFRKNLKEMRR